MQGEMARILLTASVFLSCVIALALSHQSEVPESLKAFSGTFTSQQELWTYALVSTCLISAAPFFILFFIPLDNAAEHSALLKVLLSFASGGLLGDAFLHLIPHAISPHDHPHEHPHEHHHDENDTHHHNHDHGHDHTQDMIIGLWVLAGIFAFLMVEKFVRILKGGEGHTHHLPPKDTVKNNETKNMTSNESDGTLRQRKKPNDGGNPAKKEDKSNDPRQGSIKVSAYLNLAADFAHNFTDGLAIGASYLAGPGVGVVTTLTILLHEVPHEIGDFAILIQSGYPKRKAMMLQLVTAVGAIAGTVCGLLAEGMTTAATSWILPFTAGGFIYIATVSVIPELLENSTVWQSIKELIGISIGIGMMVLIAVYE